MSNILDQIDQIINRTKCTYKEASEALEATKGDVVEAIIQIENNRTEKAQKEDAPKENTSESKKTTSSESDIKMEWKSEAFKAQMKFLGIQLKKAAKKLLKMKIAWQKNEKVYLELPLIIVILIAWFTLPFSLIVLVVPFFLGFNVLLKTSGKKDQDIGNIIKSQFDDQA